MTGETVTEYVAPLKDMQFVLKHVVGLDQVNQLPGWEEVTEDVVDAILEEAGKAHSFDLALPLQAGHRWLLIGDHHQLPPYRFDHYWRAIENLPATVAALRAHQARQLEERKAWGPGWSDTGLVFTRENGELVHPQLLSDAFDRHVRVGKFPTRREADSIAARLKREEQFNPWVTR